jgi:hypothetical protein
MNCHFRYKYMTAKLDFGCPFHHNNTFLWNSTQYTLFGIQVTKSNRH